MKTFYSFLICASLFLLVSLNLSSETQSYKSINLLPKCNYQDPLTTVGVQWSFNCTPQGTIVIDSQCCVNLWSFYGGNPPSNAPCSIVDIKCPAYFY